MTTELFGGVPLVDHHGHGVVRVPLDRAGFERLVTESHHPAPADATFFDTQLGFAIRRWCAPVLDLEPHAAPEAYLARRAELGPDEVNRRFLRASGIGTFLVETGYRAEELLTPGELAAAAGATAYEVVRLEAVAERLAREGVGAAEFADRYAEALARAGAGAVAFKSVMAYRYGLDFDPGRPAPVETLRAVDLWLRRCAKGGRVRLDDPVLLRHVLWAGVDQGLPIQFHVGYGDPDLNLHRCDPLLMTGFIRAVQPAGVPVLLLHCYPYHRQAGYLAQVFPHVYLDVGLVVNHTGARAASVLAEALELAPFHKQLFSTDAFGLPELYYLGALLFRRGFTHVVSAWVRAGDWAPDDAARVARMIGRENAERVYRLGGRWTAGPSEGQVMV